MRISDWSSDVCSSDLTAMAELAQTMELLGDDAAKVQVLMVSVDPERDTPEILSAYVSAFNPNFVGLTGSPEKLRTTATSFKTYYANSHGATPEPARMDHASSISLIATNGDDRGLVRGKEQTRDRPTDKNKKLKK